LLPSKKITQTAFTPMILVNKIIKPWFYRRKCNSKIEKGERISRLPLYFVVLILNSTGHFRN